MLIVLDPPRRSHVIQSGETTRTMLVRLRSPRRRRSSTEMMGVPGTSPLPCASRSAFWTVVRCAPALAAIASMQRSQYPFARHSSPTMRLFDKPLQDRHVLHARHIRNLSSG